MGYKNIDTSLCESSQYEIDFPVLAAKQLSTSS